MKRFTICPSIIIWEVEICDPATGETLQTELFLFRKRAERFAGKNADKISKINQKWILGGRQLWLW